MGPSGGDHHASVDRFKRQVGRPPPPVARLVSTQIWYSAEENKRTSSYARSNLSLCLAKIVVVGGRSTE